MIYKCSIWPPGAAWTTSSQYENSSQTRHCMSQSTMLNAAVIRSPFEYSLTQSECSPPFEYSPIQQIQITSCFNKMECRFRGILGFKFICMKMCLSNGLVGEAVQTLLSVLGLPDPWTSQRDFLLRGMLKTKFMFHHFQQISMT